jgi:hypothetical protein
VICKPCADAADGVDFGPIPVCSICDNGPVYVYNDARPVEEQSVVRHQREVAGVKIWCEGSKRPPRLSTGHDFCNGCDCAHKPVGSHLAPST